MVRRQLIPKAIPNGAASRAMSDRYQTAYGGNHDEASATHAAG
jgi:hypothetical protein